MRKNKTIAMIPARLGSQRVKKKNLRLINGRPLIWYVIDSAKKAGVFDEIYVNSESDEIGSFAVKEGVQFYKRPEHLASNSASNDDFLLDFMEKHECDTVIQINPTSPFIEVEQIVNFVKEMENEKWETFHSVKKVQIECLYQGKALNFNQQGQMQPSQDLTPILAFASGIMGFSVSRFKANMAKDKCAMFGGNGRTGYFVLDGWANLDIDNEDDFMLAEVVAASRSQGVKKEPKYYTADMNRVDQILEKDGVAKVDLAGANQFHFKFKEFSQSKEGVSWSKRVVNTAGYSATIISQSPGQGNRNHLHPDRDEWWVVMGGEIRWTLSDGKNVDAKQNDVVFVPKGEPHKITVIGNEPAIRLAISVDDMEHVFI